VKTRDLMELASRNLREAVLRNSLTTLGIAVGVASLVAMLSLGIGLQKFVMSKLEGSGLFNRVYVSPRIINEFGGRGGLRGGRGRGRTGSGEDSGGETAGVPSPTQIKRLTSESRKQLAALPDVVEVFPEMRLTVDLRYGGTGHVTAAASVPQSARGTGLFDTLEGTFYSSTNANEALLQGELARQLADEGKIEAKALIGQEITLRYPQRKAIPIDSNQSPGDMVANGEFGFGFTVVQAERKVRIIGIVEGEQAGPGGFGGVRVLLPIGLVEDMKPVQGVDIREVITSPGEQIYANLTILVNDPKHVVAVEDAVKKLGYNAFSLFDAARSLQRLFAVLDLFLGIFGSLALAVASLGIINTLVMAILERRHEIGVLKALGAADRDVRQIFFAEAGAMGLFGGIVGVALGWGIGRIINFVTNIYLTSQNIPTGKIWSVPLWLVGAAIGFSVLVSLAAGLYPASRAAKLDPVKALRYE
jgi:putative ABC transport system permease protein